MPFLSLAPNLATMANIDDPWSGLKGSVDLPPQKIEVKRTFIQIDPKLFDPRQIKSWAAGDTDTSDCPTTAEDSAGDLGSGSEFESVKQSAPTYHSEAAKDTLTTRASTVNWGKTSDGPKLRSNESPPQPTGTRGMPESVASSAFSQRGASRRRRILQKDSRKGEDAARQFLLEGDWPPGTALHLALSGETGSRVVQGALEEASCHVGNIIVNDFVGHVSNISRHPHAVHVLRKIVMHIDEGTAGFVARELRGNGCSLSTRKFACRVVCEMLRQRWRAEASLLLLSEVVASQRALWRMQYATYIFQDILKLGTNALQQQVMSSLLVDFQTAWPEVSRAIRCPRHDGEVHCVFVVAIAVSEFGKHAEPLIAAIIRDADIVRSLVERKYGYVLLKAVLQVQGPLAEDVHRKLLGAWAGFSSEQAASLMERCSVPCARCIEIQASCRNCSRSLAALQSLLEELRA